MASPNPTWGDHSFPEAEDDLSHHFAAAHLQVSAPSKADRRHSLTSSSPDSYQSQANQPLPQPPQITSTPRKQRWKTGISPWPIIPASVPSVEVSPSSSEPPLEGKREPLRSVISPPQENPTVARATPFLPGISGGIWSPPGWPTQTPPEKDTDDKDAQIRVLQEQVDRLTREKDMAINDNVRLATEVQKLSSLALPPVAPIPIRPFGALPYSVPSLVLGDNGFPPVGMPMQDHCRPLETPTRTNSSESNGGGYRPSHMTVDLILSGKLDYMRMDPRSEYDLTRPLVWTIAHQEPKSNGQAATLKIAANALGGRLGQPRSLPSTQYLINTILEWARPLCFTSNGNYLCQQLLEKGTSEDKINFIKVIESDIVPIANNKFGAHVLVKAISVKELEGRISDALFKFGVFESMQTGARKVWRPYLGKCRNANENEIFERIANEMKGRWSDLAVSNENGSISVQQIFEGCANQDLMDACFQEIIEDISRVANNQFGHFVINKLLNFQEPMIKAVSNAILTAYPPLATNHHGVQFVEFVIGSNRLLQRNHIAKYLEALCSQEAGRTPAIVAVANSSVGRGHLQSVLRQVPPGERVLMSRVHNTCRQFQTTLRNSQSGNELLRSLGIINTPARRG